MPTRYLKESICTSESLAALGAEAERFWYRLLVQCDDFGRMDARPAILRALCFPLLLDAVSETNIEDWLQELEQAGLLTTYIVAGKRYLEIPTFTQHNTPRAKASKYPQPPAPADNCKQMQADASRRMQIPSYSKIEDRISRSYIEIESEEEAPAVEKQSAPPSSSSSPSLDSYSLVVSTWEQRMGQTTTALLGEKFRDALKVHGTHTICEAIGEAANAGKPRWDYVAGILRNWESQGRRQNGNGAYPARKKDGRSPLMESDPNATEVTWTVIDL